MTSESTTPTKPQTGEVYLESLRDGRNVWIYGQRVDDVTTHPAFRNAARTIAGLYDTLHDPVQPQMRAQRDDGVEGTTHPFFKIATSRDDLRQSAQAIETWHRQTFGWLGRSPDYKSALMTTLGANPEFFGEYEQNARTWYSRNQEKVLHVGHAIVHPPVDRHLGPEQSDDVFVRVVRENDRGIVVSGAKVVATGSATAQYIYVSHSGAPVKDKRFALTFLAPVAGPGTHLYARASYEEAASRMGSPYDYPLSSRFDENDAILVFDEAEIPWENVLLYDPDRLNAFDRESAWPARAMFQSAIRMGVKLEFLGGALSKALDITGADAFRGVQANLGEVLSYQKIINSMRDGMIEGSSPGWGGAVEPNLSYGLAYASIAATFYRRTREIIQSSVASGLIYLNSNAVDFGNEQIRGHLEQYLRGSNGLTAYDRTKTMKLLWDSVGSEFAARHELYEMNYFGPAELNRLRILESSKADGTLDAARALAEGGMADYDLDGWKTPGLESGPTAFAGEVPAGLTV